jgi:hypothetical protein
MDALNKCSMKKEKLIYQATKQEIQTEGQQLGKKALNEG